MPQPVVTAMLGSSDITTRVAGPDGTWSATWTRGTNLDGGSVVGSCKLVVRNNDRAFNWRNGSSPFITNLKINKIVLLTAVHSATTYYLFTGYLRRITYRDDGFAELYAEDAFYKYDGLETDVSASSTRSLSAFRGLVLDDADGDATRRDLPTGSGPEAAVVLSGGSQDSSLAALEDINRATGSVHWIKPTASPTYKYTVKDRLHFQGAASSESWSDADFANPFAEDLEGTDLTADLLINRQKVVAESREPADGSILWQANKDYVLGTSSSRTLWPELDDPALSADAESDALPSGASITVTRFYDRVKIVLATGANAATFRNLLLRGKSAIEKGRVSIIAEDSASIATYGKMRGDVIRSEYLMGEADAEGLASYYLWRYATIRDRPALRFVNRFPTQLTRDVADVVTVTSTALSGSSMRLVLTGLTTTVSEFGGRWDTRYTAEELPAALDLFTVGGTAGQGIGGSGILGY